MIHVFFVERLFNLGYVPEVVEQLFFVLVEIASSIFGLLALDAMLPKIQMNTDIK